MANASDFINAPAVAALVPELKRVLQGKVISDVLDTRGHQYVDLVMEGGGMLGIALLGYTWALEQAGVRFASVGGASAGAINALGLAAAVDPAAPMRERSVRLIEPVAAMDPVSFLDGDNRAREMILAYARKKNFMMVLNGLVAFYRNHQALGLHPGDAFQEWVAEVIAALGVMKAGDIDTRMRAVQAALHIRPGSASAGQSAPLPKLGIVCAEVTTESRVVFPEMAVLFSDRPETLNPSLYARASMSIPGVFRPYLITGIPQGAEAKARWKQHVSYEGTLPKTGYFVDGGIISNFPIDIFHTKSVPSCPTFGVKLGKDRTAPLPVSDVFGYVGAIFDTARHFHDFTFIARNPDFQKLVAYIETPEDVGWLQFDMSLEAKIALFASGANTALEFLTKFDWKQYQDYRRENPYKTGKEL